MNISEAAFVDLVNEAQVLANAIAERLDIARNDGVDWMQRIWVRQRILMTTSCFDESSSLEELAYLHQLVSRSLFSQPPLILIQLQGQTILQQLGGGDLVIRTGSRTSLVAASIRASNVRAVDDSADLAVVDRQLLRVMQARSALIVPLVSEGLMAALVLKYDVHDRRLLICFEDDETDDYYYADAACPENPADVPWNELEWQVAVKNEPHAYFNGRGPAPVVSWEDAAAVQDAASAHRSEHAALAQDERGADQGGERV